MNRSILTAGSKIFGYGVDFRLSFMQQLVNSGECLAELARKFQTKIPVKADFSTLIDSNTRFPSQFDKGCNSLLTRTLFEVEMEVHQNELETMSGSQVCL